MIRAGVIRFPLVVLPPALWVRVAFGVAAAFGAWTLILDPGGGQLDSALGSILLLQMFAVSNGFTAAAARGHFDPILVSGRSRLAIGAGAAVGAALPGALAWMAILLLASALGEPLSEVVAPHRQTALLVISGVSWAAGVRLPRLAAGALWSVVLVGLLMSRTFFAQQLVTLEQVPANVYEIVVAAAACVLCPFLFLGSFPGAADLRVVFLALAIAVVFVMRAILYLARRDYALTELE
jgi:hypothetical protein